MSEGYLRAGAEVVFVHEILTPLRRTARAFDTARVVCVLAHEDELHPDDLVEVAFRGEHFVVTRRALRHSANRFAGE
jgi:hypothetical protein